MTTAIDLMFQVEGHNKIVNRFQCGVSILGGRAAKTDVGRPKIPTISSPFIQQKEMWIPNIRGTEGIQQDDSNPSQLQKVLSMDQVKRVFFKGLPVRTGDKLWGSGSEVKEAEELGQESVGLLPDPIILGIPPA